MNPLLLNLYCKHIGKMFEMQKIFKLLKFVCMMICILIFVNVVSLVYIFNLIDTINTPIIVVSDEALEQVLQQIPNKKH